MFSRSKDNDPAPTPAPVKRGARTAAPSIISADLTVQGTLVSTGDIQIDGKVEGDVRSGSLVVGDKAFIHGEIIVEEVTVRGRIQGSIRARKVQLCSTCHVEGNILHEALAVETGAYFEGNCRHSENPLAESEGTAKPETRGAERKVSLGSSPAGHAPKGLNGGDDHPRAATAGHGKPAATFAPLKSGS